VSKLTRNFHFGFTLIELLVVIAVMAVIAAAVLVAINPVDKIRAGQDAKVQSDIAQVAGAISAYETGNNGTLPAWTDWTAISGGLLAAGELTAVPQDPDGTGALYTYTGATTVGPPPTALVWSRLQSRKYVGTALPSKCISPALAYWFWNTASGQACGSCAVPTVAMTCVSPQWLP